MMLVRHHQPIYALPNGTSVENDYLDELWCDPKNKNIPYTASFWDLLWKKEMTSMAFTALDSIIYYLGGLRHFPLRRYARQQCVKWILDHQEISGDWAGSWPAMQSSVLALTLEGFDLNHSAVHRGLEAIERFTCNDQQGKRLQVTVSPVWDTVHMMVALCDSGMTLDDKRLKRAVQWIKDHQLLIPKGDWRVYNPSLEPGGWSFQYFNTQNPDVDDTVTAILALVKHDPKMVASPRISRAVQWILGMQNRDGGWAAFDVNNNQLFLNKIPFSDMDSLCDPSTPDPTGRVLECFGVFLTSPHRQLIESQLLARMKQASTRAITYLESTQEGIGAWWSRWGCNYIHGTSMVLCGLTTFSKDDDRVRAMTLLAIRWLKSVQNVDGGWGEGTDSYENQERAGRGVSTASQTAWGIIALLAHLPPSDEAIRKGISYLISSQTDQREKGSTWPETLFTATGFPEHMYMGYSLYPHYFPMIALGRYIKSCK
jgi:squalene-hopene/tetraprenyl-beta-curcumene cyclase